MSIKTDLGVDSIVPSGSLKKLKVSEIKPSVTNPRQLFDPEPLAELKESIRQHGVLVPLTVYKLKAQDKYAILDGERRFRCCRELADEGAEILVPANIVEPPNKIANLLYMFSIHNFREQWELMPTALSLKVVIDELGESDNKRLSQLTGLSDTQIERCKSLLEFSKKFQNMSLDSDPKTRIPSNFWIEALPVLKLYEEYLPELFAKKTRDGITDILVKKYREGNIKSVIHFRRIREAFVRATEEENKVKISELVGKLKKFIEVESLEIKETFDAFLPTRSVGTVIRACEDFSDKLRKLKLEFVTEDRGDLAKSLRKVKKDLEKLLEQIQGDEPPTSK